MNTETQHETSEQLAVSARTAAALLGISVRHLWTLNSAGRLPKPIRLGRSVRWRRDELLAWLDADCPPRDRWEQLKAARS